MKFQLLTIGVGCWLAGAGATIGLDGPARALHEIAGPLVAATATVACFDLGRPLRWLNAAIAVLFALIAILPPFTDPSAVLSALPAAAVIVIAALRTPVADLSPYGGGWRTIVRRHPG